MKLEKGVLLTCDPAVKQILLMLNNRQPFILQDLDEFHVVIKAELEAWVRSQLETELEKNTYNLE
ncbi:nucleotide excision repair TFIIH subunit [Vararia minispora EC-137]|uniref:Nucleotide excision repair TFIIH subunit n=1 Tax=Vararia minispora EC-137 TaxID=1314806 RepID=A0ACB8R004_9AGAM|nr:nucleotide excision repair TFIIH subunit [Vararia minispora EC-137]